MQNLLNVSFTKVKFVVKYKNEARNEGFLFREVLRRRSYKEDRVLEVDSAFERQGWRG